MGWFKNLIVYSHSRPQPIRATHNRVLRPVNIAKLPELLRKLSYASNSRPAYIRRGELYEPLAET